MWARAGRGILAAFLLAAGGASVGGCNMSPSAEARWQNDEPVAAYIASMNRQDSAAFQEGLALAADLKYPQAQEKFAIAVAWYEAARDRPRIAEAKFWLAFCHEKQGRFVEARALYKEVVLKHRGTPAAGQAADRLRRLPKAN